MNAAVVAPTITTQPQSVTVTAGQTATFTVVATGTAPLAYQWRRNGTDIAGATSASYTTPATTVADSGAVFSVRITNASPTAAVSANAMLTVNAVPPTPVAPSITTQPQNVSVTAGQTATFTVVATGTAPLAYQWRRNGTDIAGATGASYTTPATSAVAGLTVSLASPSPARLTVGNGHVVAIRANGAVIAWGLNNVGQLGNGLAIPGSNAREVATTAIGVAAGSFESLALGADGVVRGWGRKFGSTTIIGGDAAGAGTDVPSPVPSAFPSGVRDVITGTGNLFALALRSDGSVWHLPGSATLITGGFAHAARQVAGLADIASLGRNLAGDPVAVGRDGRVWRVTFVGQAGANWSASGTVVAGLTDAVSAACVGAACIALRGDGTVFGIGGSSPGVVNGLSDVRSIAVTGSAFLAVDGAGRLWTWNTGAPTQVAGVSDVVEVAGGLQTVLVRRVDGTVWGYGPNLFGELGSQPASSTPVQVPAINLN
ncbi:MAG: immunoglobulin domain-containing protein [Burkholderiaceae bacterium]|nr:immunoglobulin domain-containing protein [Burkholderiaceae bacterium]